MKLSITKVLYLTGIILFIPAFIQAQNTGKKSRMAMHKEVKEGAYVPVPSFGSKTSPAYTFKSSEIFTTQVNIDSEGNNILGDAANEPSIAIDPTNPDRMAIGWRQFNTVTNSFRQAGYGYSTNGGETWTFPGVIEPGIFRSDPVLDADSEGNFYYNSLTSNNGDYTCKVFRILDGGYEWDGGVEAFGGDKQWMTIDRSGGVGNGNIYSFWTSYYSTCYPENYTRSTDGGNSYENCVFVDGDPYWGTMTVGNNGELYVAGSGEWDGFVVAKSTNAQIPGAMTIWDVATPVDVDGYLTGWTNINPAGLLGQVYIDVDRSNGPGRDNIYVCASVERNSTYDPGDVMFSKSIDGGLSFLPPVRINDDPTNSKYQWFGTMSVAPNGRIDVIWLDNRDAVSGYYSALYYSYSLDQGDTWSPNQKLSESFDPHAGWPQQEKMGDYFEMISDETSAHLAWANTLNFEQDVYYSRITPTFTGINDLDAGGSSLSISCSPNPVSENAVIRYSLPDESNVRIVIVDMFGKEVVTLVNEKQMPGLYQADFSRGQLTAGYYFCRIYAGNQTASRSLVLIR